MAKGRDTLVRKKRNSGESVNSETGNARNGQNAVCESFSYGGSLIHAFPNRKGGDGLPSLASFPR